MTLIHTLVHNNGHTYLTVYVPGFDPLGPITEDHPNWDAINEAVQEGYSYGLSDLFDVSQAVRKRFEALGESTRVTVSGGVVYFDGDPVHSSISDHIVRFLEEDVEDWKPLVRFLDKLMQNPNEHSREQLYDWLQKNDGFTITEAGDLLGYKGVRKNADGSLVSISSGPGIVNGESMVGNLPNEVGNVVQIARSSVEFNPAVGCATGLHVGTYDYAKGFAQGAVLECHVNPRDVVSVPTDCSWQKVRCSGYRVVGVIDQPNSSAVTAAYPDWDDDWPDEDPSGEGDLPGCVW